MGLGLLVRGTKAAMPLSARQRDDIQRSFERGDRRTKTVVPVLIGVAILVALAGFATGSRYLQHIGLTVALTLVALTLVGHAMKAWMRKRL
jgi:hypothetical protein